MSTSPSSTSTSPMRFTVLFCFLLVAIDGVCSPGYGGVGGNNTVCHICAKGTFKEVIGNEACTACNISWTTAEHGSTSATDCICKTNAYALENMMCVCKPGAFLDKNDTCLLCVVGTYKTNGGNENCTHCNTDYSTHSQGSTSATDCMCDSGLFLDEHDECVACPAKTYNPNVGASGIDECIDCPYRYFQPNMGQSVCIPLFVVLKDLDEDIGRVIGLFVEGDTSCAYISKTSGQTPENVDGTKTTHKMCWGQVTEKHPKETILSIAALSRVCGDNIIHPTLEQCDDGNMWNGDGCSNTCEIEDGFFCEALVTTANITENLLRTSMCCRVLGGPPTNTPRCTRCGDRNPPYDGVRYQTDDCRLIDIDECATGEHGCFGHGGGKQCVNIDAVANNGTRFKCECPKGHYMSDSGCIAERFATRFVLGSEIDTNIDTDVIESHIRDEALRVLGSSAIVDLRIEHSVNTTRIQCTIFVNSWQVMQNLTAGFDTARLVQNIIAAAA
jgi:cysteine-rich repeat protein